MTTIEWVSGGKRLDPQTMLEKISVDAAQIGELRYQRCHECGHVRFPPGPICPRCWVAAYEWITASGKGTVWAWIEFHQRYFMNIEHELPYAVVCVELAEGPLIMTNLVGDTARAQVGAPVRAVKGTAFNGEQRVIFELE